MVATQIGMVNEEGKVVDMYIPRKCSATNRVLGPKEHSSVQINVGEIDEEGKYTRKNQTFAVAGYMRQKGASDSALNWLFQEKGFLTFQQ